VSKRFSARGADSLIPLRQETNLSAEAEEIAELFRTPIPPLSQMAAARIRRKLEAVQPARRTAPWFRWVVGVAAALFLLETMTAAAITAWPPLKERFWAAVAAQHQPTSPRKRRGQSEGASSAEASPLVWVFPGGNTAEPKVAAPTPSTSIASAEVAAPSGATKRSIVAAHIRAPVPSPAPTVRPSTAEAELALYSRALSQLNVEHDPTAALGTLGVYSFRYPQGILRKEATIAQVKAELMLGLDAQALGLLDAMNEQDFAGFPKSTEARLLRAELLVHAQRCNEVLPTLGGYLVPSVDPEQRSRALFLRGVCRSQLKDFAGSREDLSAYLREFPSGPFASKAAETLKGLP
jgi:hypothetical protein